MDPRSRTDAVISRLADAQHGVVARRQLLAAGVSRDAVRGRLRRGLLLSLHRGVYAVGHQRLTRHGRWLAAVLAAGPGAVLSHRDAGVLHGLGQWNYGRFEVTAAADIGSTARIRVFARRQLVSEDVTVVEAIPVTAVARTLVDLAELLSYDRLLDVLTGAEQTRQFDLHALHRALDRVSHRPGPGHARLLAALTEQRQRGLQLTRSQLEIALRRLVREQRLPPAQLNARIDGEEVDAYWPEQRLVVEADGWEFHRDRASFARDRAKTNDLTLLGYTVLRFTHDDVVRRQSQTAAKIRNALSRATAAR